MFYDEDMNNVNGDSYREGEPEENCGTAPEEQTSEYAESPVENDIEIDAAECVEEPETVRQPEPTVKFERREPRYEPWREPVYREPEDRSNAYTPGIHSTQYRSFSQPYQAKQEKPKKKHGFLKAVCLVLVCAIVASAASYAVVDTMLKKNASQLESSDKTVVINQSTDSSTKKDSGTSTVSNTGDILSPEEIYANACRQVVGIQTPITTTNFFGMTSTSAVSGSGFIISSDGYIVTNYHVIEYSVLYGYDLTVMMYDGTTYTAEIIGYEEENDIAVIKIEASDLSPATFGKSSDMVVGESVYAVGNPLGELEYTMTSGIVSALDRVITLSDSTNGGTKSISMFQVDAAINEGNSGGPIYNAKGEVIGIVTAKKYSTGVEGLGFAIPSDDAFTIVSDLIENGYVTGKAYFGITVSTITESYAKYYGLVTGAYVESVADGSCAQIAGMQAGDIITELGDYTVTSKDDLLTAKKNFHAGDTTGITVYRNGEYLDFIITLDEEPPATQTQQQTQQQYGQQYGQGQQQQQYQIELPGIFGN